MTLCRAARRRRRRRTSRCPARPRRSAATASDRRRGLGSSDEGAVSQWDAQVLGLGAVGTDELTVDAVGLVTGLADLAGVVGGEERTDHELAGLDRGDLGADFFDDADVFVAHRGGLLGGGDGAVV